mgnify:CR=1 FL=1
MRKCGEAVRLEGDLARVPEVSEESLGLVERRTR